MVDSPASKFRPSTTLARNLSRNCVQNGYKFFWLKTTITAENTTKLNITAVGILEGEYRSHSPPHSYFVVPGKGSPVFTSSPPATLARTSRVAQAQCVIASDLTSLISRSSRRSSIISMVRYCWENILIKIMKSISCDSQTSGKILTLEPQLERS